VVTICNQNGGKRNFFASLKVARAFRRGETGGRPLADAPARKHFRPEAARRIRHGENGRRGAAGMPFNPVAPATGKHNWFLSVLYLILLTSC
jgi:hypothetical protein